MTTIQFTYMMGVLWLIFAVAVRSGDKSGADWSFIYLVFVIGVVHIVLAIGLFLRGLFLGG